jgi:transcriptional regulator GlxA family with amidase domain
MTAAATTHDFIPHDTHGLGALALLLIGIAGFFLLKWKKTQQRLYGTYQKNALNPSNNLLEKLEHYISTHLTEANVGSLSAYSGLPQRSLYRFLQDHHCITPGDLIRTVRVRHAKKLMETTPSLSKEEIAEATGLSVFQITRIATE